MWSEQVLDTGCTQISVQHQAVHTPTQVPCCNSVVDSDIGIGYENSSSKVKQITSNYNTFEKDLVKTARVVAHSTQSCHLASLLRHTRAEHHRTLWKNLPNSVNICHFMYLYVTIRSFHHFCTLETGSARFSTKALVSILLLQEALT